MHDVADGQLLDQLHRYADGLESCVASVSADEIVGDDGIPWAPAHRPARRGRMLWIASASALVLLVVGGAVLVARHDQDRYQQPADGTALLRGDELRDQLVGRTFVSTSVLEYGDDDPLVDENGSPGGQLLLEFRETSVRWSAGCESSSTAYEIDGDRLVLTDDQVARGQPACDGAIAGQETMWNWAVGMRPMIWLDDGVLTMLVGDQYRIELVDESTLPDGAPTTNTPSTPPLLGTRWGLDVNRSVPGFPVSFKGMFFAYLDFADTDGDAKPDSVSGKDGCNDLGGSVAVEGDRLTIVVVSWTEVACGAPIDSVSATMASILQGESTYVIEGDELRITNAEGTVSFRAPR